MLKASQPEKKQPVPPKHQNGILQRKGVKENSSKDFSKNTVSVRQTDNGKKEKNKTVPSSAEPKDSQMHLKTPGVSEAKQSAASKRKKNAGKSNSEPPAKKKPVVEDKKPTE